MYCTITDVQGLMAGRQLTFSSTSNPTDTIVNSWLTMIYDEINQTISRAGYTIPQTTNGYLQLTQAYGVAGLVETALNVEGTSDAVESRNFKTKEYQNRLADIKKDPRMTGAVPISSAEYGQKFASSDVTIGYKNTNATFTKDGNNW